MPGTPPASNPPGISPVRRRGGLGTPRVPPLGFFRVLMSRVAAFLDARPTARRFFLGITILLWPTTTPGGGGRLPSARGLATDDGCQTSRTRQTRPVLPC